MAFILVISLAALSLAFCLAVLVFLLQGALFNRFEGLLKNAAPFLVFLTGLLAIGLPVLVGSIALRSAQFALPPGLELWSGTLVKVYVATIALLTLIIYLRKGMGQLLTGLSPTARRARRTKAQGEDMRRHKKLFGEEGETGQKSEGADFIELTYNRKKELIDCEILDGRFEGEDVDDMSIFELLSLWFEIFEHDIESARKLEKYLDFAMPDWRAFFLKMAKAAHGPEKRRPEKRQRKGRDHGSDRDSYDAGAQEAQNLRSNVVTREEAYEILGLSHDASWADINQAYRDMMKAVHPDQGGSSYLAAKVNQAKDLLLDEMTGTRH